MTAITAKAEREKRDLTRSEIDRWEADEKRTPRRPGRAGGDQPRGARAIADYQPHFEEVRMGVDVTGGRTFSYGYPRQEDGIRVLGPEERMTSLGDGGSSLPGLSFDGLLRAYVTGDWGRLPDEARALSVGTGTAGGFLVPTPLSARIIDLARNQTRVVQAGAVTIPMDEATLKIARVSGDGSAAWKVENAAITASDMTFEQVTFTARTLVAMVKASVELMEDAVDTGVVERSLSAALALELDRAALRGSGTPPEPEGILNQTGVTVTAGIGTPADYSELSQAIQDVRALNHEPNAILFSARDAGHYDRLQDSTNQPMMPPPSVAAIRKLVTNQIPTNLGAGTNESEIYVGDFSQLMLGMRRQIVVEVSRQAADGTEGAFTNLQVWIRAYLRADVQLAHPEAFNVLTGVTVV